MQTYCNPSCHIYCVELQQSLRTSEDRSDLLTQQKSSLEDQMEQLSHMSGDSSQQLSFLQDQIKDKER